MLNETSIAQRLSSNLGYSAAESRSAAAKLIRLQPSTHEAFLNWWQSGVMDSSFSVDGISIAGLMESRGINPVAALLIVDWLLRDPVEAKKALKYGIK
jgi:hypothetical protein